MPYEEALRAARRTGTTISTRTSRDLASVVDMDAIRGAGFSSASIRSAARAFTTGRAIAERYDLDLTVVSDVVDQTFRFMTSIGTGRSAWIRRRRTRCSG